MENKIKIIDSSGDRNYFTIIPNYILNHSSSDEQSLYLQMKRFAGEKGKCFATQKTLGEKLEWNRKKVSSIIQKLLERKWINQIGTMVTKTSPVNVYEIIDLWLLNSEFYKEKRRVKTGHLSNSNKRDVPKEHTSGVPKRDIEEEPIKEEPNTVETGVSTVFREKENERLLRWRHKLKEENPEKYQVYLKEQRERNKKRWQEKREELIEIHKKWVEENRDKVRHLNQRAKARRKGAEGLHTLEEWENLKREFNYCCPDCGRKEPEIVLTKDHIIPLSCGGSDYIENIQPLCGECNKRKYTTTQVYFPVEQIYPSFLDRFLESRWRHLQIIGVWVREKGIALPNKSVYDSILKRNIRTAKLLEGYSNKQIVETVRVLRNTDYIKKFTLETILKYVDEVVVQEQKQGRKIIRFEEINKDGARTMRAVYENGKYLPKDFK